MSYTSRIIDRAFATSPTGERLFYLDGFWAQPYIIPDEQTELVLRRKHAALTNTMGSIVMPALTIALWFRSQINWSTTLVVGLLLLSVLLHYVVRWAVFGNELRYLTRAPRTMVPRNHYAYQMANTYSLGVLLLGLLGSAVLVAAGVFAYSIGVSVFNSLFLIALFGCFACLFGYAFYLKLVD